MRDTTRYFYQVDDGELVVAGTEGQSDAIRRARSENRRHAGRLRIWSDDAMHGKALTLTFDVANFRTDEGYPTNHQRTLANDDAEGSGFPEFIPLPEGCDITDRSPVPGLTVSEEDALSDHLKSRGFYLTIALRDEDILCNECGEPVDSGGDYMLCNSCAQGNEDNDYEY